MLCSVVVFIVLAVLALIVLDVLLILLIVLLVILLVVITVLIVHFFQAPFLFSPYIFTAETDYTDKGKKTQGYFYAPFLRSFFPLSGLLYARLLKIKKT